MNLIFIGRTTFIRVPYILGYADIEADKEINNSSIGNKTTNIFYLNPVCNGCYIVIRVNIKKFFPKSKIKEKNVNQNIIFGI